ncbi:biotin-dependent carboxyltransferase [Thioclava sp. BHET1]|nr:biotin-dependent carboxyltransferase [Thioclava sp. BHET1]
MRPELIIHSAGPGVSVQDLGRPGQISIGLSRGGAADRRALFEAAALLGQPAPLAALEMAGMGGSFEVTAPTRIALTGAPMEARLDGAALAWHASHLLQPGQRLTIGGVRAGSYGYLSFAGGLRTEPVMGSRSTHLVAGLGAALEPGARLPLGEDPAPDRSARSLPVADRFSGGTLRYIHGPQTGYFSAETVARFDAAKLIRSATGNRQGVKLETETGPFPPELSGGLASDFIQEGDIQMTGAGLPFVLLCECQTIGGYPRIGTVLPCDLPRIAQAPPGALLRFQAVDLAEADQIMRNDAREIDALAGQTTHLIRDPRLMHDLLSYQLISGVTAGRELEEE